MKTPTETPTTEGKLADIAPNAGVDSATTATDAVAIDNVPFIEIPGESIVVDHTVNRRYFPHSAKSIKSLRAEMEATIAGQTTPVHVIVRNGAYHLVNGFGRFAAIMDHNAEATSPDNVWKVKATILDASLTDAELQALNIRDNMRAITSVVDHASAIAHLRTMSEYQRKSGKGDKMIADDAKIGEVFGNKSVGWVRSTVSILALPDKILQDVHAGEINFDAALGFLDFPDHDAMLKAYADAKVAMERRVAAKEIKDAAKLGKTGKTTGGKSAPLAKPAPKANVVKVADVKATKAKAGVKAGALTLPELKAILKEIVAENGAITRAASAATLLAAIKGDIPKEDLKGVLTGAIKATEIWPRVNPDKDAKDQKTD